MRKYKTRRKEEAKLRQATAAQRSPQAQLKLLDEAGYVAKKEHAKLLKKIELINKK
jgi:hypothetical protein